MLFSDTFDTTYALSSMFLWIAFSLLVVMINCDVQRLVKSNPIVMHLLGLTAFFFLFTLLDSNNKQALYIIYFKTMLVYFLFVLMTKSKWYFVVPVLLMLLIDQSIKKQVAIDKANERDVSELQEKQRQITKLLNILIITTIVIGAIHYMYLQKLQYKNQFSLYKFFVSPANTCRPIKN